MMKIYKQIPFGHPLRSDDDDFALVIDQYTGQLLQMESLQEEKKLVIKNKSIDFKPGKNSYKVHYNLLDTNVTICALDVLNHFMDNFDFNVFQLTIFNN